MAAWSTVPQSDLGHAVQVIGAAVRPWVELPRCLLRVVAGVGFSVAGGVALLEPDRSLPRLARQFVFRCAPGGYGGALAAFVPADVPTIRGLALALLLAGLVLAAIGFLGLCNWFLDRKE